MKFRLAAAVALIYNSSRTSCYSSRNIIFRPEVSQMISLKISFRISFQYILVRRADLNIKSQDLSHLVPIWSTLGTNQISLLLYRSTLSSTSLGRGRERTRERGRWGGEVTVKRERRKCWCGETREEWLPLAVPRTDCVNYCRRTPRPHPKQRDLRDVCVVVSMITRAASLGHTKVLFKTYLGHC